MHYVQAKSLLLPGNRMNLYRGCQHGCIYCDSRSRCYHMEHAFEDIEVKQNAPELLERALRSRKQRGMVGMGSMSDPYIPLEKELGYTRKALEIICRHSFGATLITKSDLVLRDLDLLTEINRRAKCVIQMTVTTLDEELCRKIEPAVCTTQKRFSALQQLAEAGIPTVVWLCPVLPFLNDTEENIAGILDRCRQVGVSGVISFGMGLTLREGNREYFYKQLDRDFPGLKEKYIRTYGERYELPSPNSEKLTALFGKKCEELGLMSDVGQIFSYLQTLEQDDGQMTLF